jgi:hypothetical protein
MCNREKYINFCDTQKHLPLFLSYKWLDLIARNQWEVIIDQSGNEINGIFPYVIFKKKGFTIIDHPPLTPIGGIWLNYPPDQKYNNRLKFEKETTERLIQQIPKFDFFNIKFHPRFQNWLPFYWNKYQQTTRYTYLLDDLTDLEKIYKEFNLNIRRDIAKAEKASIEVKVSNEIETFCRLKDLAFTEGGLNIKVTNEQIKSIYEFCINEKAGELWIAKSGSEIHAASIFVWDNQTCYYLYGVSNPHYKASGAMSLLLWRAIQKYSSSVKEFNFEGSMIEGVERFFRGFGGKQVPYFHISKTNSKLLKLRSFIHELLQ